MTPVTDCYIKIGYARNDITNSVRPAMKRLKSCETGNPRPLFLILALDIDCKDNELHKIFSEYRVRREWFRCRGFLQKFIQDHFRIYNGRKPLKITLDEIREYSK